MPSDEYTSASAGGALRIKGAKVKKPKKKKTGKSDLEKNLSTGGESSTSSSKRKDALPEDPATEKEEEDRALASDNDDRGSKSRKTETERRFEEARRKKLLELSEQANARPELLKTHKERVEELNTYLSKLSEHHDMPKIGPG